MDVGDPALRGMLEAARAWNVSPRRFLGWEAAAVTTYEYDLTGRLIRSVTLPEAEWDQDDRDLALSLLAYEAELCPGCRQPLAQTTAAGNEYRYRSGPAIRCHRCTASQQAAAAYQDSPSPEALFIPVEFLRDDVEVRDAADLDAEQR